MRKALISAMLLAGVALIIFGIVFLNQPVEQAMLPPEPRLTVPTAVGTDPETAIRPTAVPVYPDANRFPSAPVIPAPLPTPAQPSPSEPEQPPMSLPAANPEHLYIPAIGVDDPVVPVGLNAEGAVEPPFLTVGWYTGGFRPGEPGSALIAAHVSSQKYREDIFHDLGQLQPDDPVVIRQPYGELTYVVYSVEQHDKQQVPWDRIEAVKDESVLWLVTCGGDFDSASGSFKDNIVVRAELVDTRPFPSTTVAPEPPQEE